MHLTHVLPTTSLPGLSHFPGRISQPPRWPPCLHLPPLLLLHASASGIFQNHTLDRVTPPCLTSTEPPSAFQQSSLPSSLPRRLQALLWAPASPPALLPPSAPPRPAQASSHRRAFPECSSPPNPPVATLSAFKLQLKFIFSEKHFLTFCCQCSLLLPILTLLAPSLACSTICTSASLSLFSVLSTTSHTNL